MPRKIPTHQSTTVPKASRTYERAAQRKADVKWYHSKAWLALRDEKLASDPLCEQCLKENRFVPAEHVHHVYERKTHPELALEYGNLESACVACHNRKRTHAEADREAKASLPRPQDESKKLR